MTGWKTELLEQMVDSSTAYFRGDIVGTKIVEILQVCRIDVEGLDFADSYFRLDSGIVTTLPSQDLDAFYEEDLPELAEPIEHPLLGHVYNQRIAEVLRESDDSGVYHDSIYLRLANGYLVTDIQCEHHGTGAVGIYVYRPNEIIESRISPFWP